MYSARLRSAHDLKTTTTLSTPIRRYLHTYVGCTHTYVLSSCLYAAFPSYSRSESCHYSFHLENPNILNSSHPQNLLTSMIAGEGGESD